MKLQYYSKERKPDNFESYNPLKFTFTNIPGLHSNFVGCESFWHSSSTWDKLGWLKWLILLILKDFFSHMHNFAVYMKEGFRFAQKLSLENSQDSYIHFCYWFYFIHCLTSFSCINHLLCLWIFDTIPSHIDEVFSINLSTNVVVFGNFNVHHRAYLTYSGRTDGPNKPFYNLTQMVNFFTRIPDCDTQSCSFELFFSYASMFYCGFHCIGEFDVVSVSIEFLSNSKGDCPFHGTACEYFRADWDGLCNHLRNVLWDDIFKLGASVAGTDFVSRSWLELMNLSLIENMRSSIFHLNGFWQLVLLPQFIEITYIVCTNRMNLYYRWNSDRQVIVVNRLLKLPNLLMFILNKDYHSQETWLS